MRFRDLPQPLRLYILLHPVVMAPFLFGVLRLPVKSEWNWGIVAALVLSTFIFSGWKLELPGLHRKMTPTFAVECLALLIQGPQAAVLCATVGSLAGSLLQPHHGSWRLRYLRQPWYRVVLNVSNGWLACTAASLVYTAVLALPQLKGSGPQWTQLVALVAFALTDFAIDTAGIARAISLQQGVSWGVVFTENLWIAPTYIGQASAALGIQLAYSGPMGPLSLAFMPILFLGIHHYRLHLDKINLDAERVRQENEHHRELNELNQAVIDSLATAIDAKDRYTRSHINRVRHYAITLAKAAGVEGPELQAIATGAVVHDIGKLGVPDHILGKPGKLTPDEFRRMQSHVLIGAEILAPVPFPFPVVDVVMTHHERWDGLGYPNGLKGEAIPIGGRVISIVDVFDALTSDRPYRRALTLDEALRAIREGAGRQFDPRLVELFAGVLPQARREIEAMEAGSPERQSPLPAAAEGSADVLARISQSAAEMAAVCEVVHALAEQERMDAVARLIVDRAIAHVPGDTAVLYLRDGDTAELVAAAVQGKYEQKLDGMTIQVGEGVVGWVVEHQQPRVNVSAAPDVARRFSPEDQMELSAATVVPLVHGPETLGALAVYTMAYSVLSEHHLNVLNILAEHAAAAIQNLRRIERNRELAFTDPLTGLANSRCLVRHLEQLDQPETDTVTGGRLPYSVVMLDLDHFKEVNDRYGHLCGDDLLRSVAEALMSVVRPIDVVCRYAGDEFVILLPGAGADRARQVAVRATEAVARIPAVDGRLPVSVSVGVASSPADGSDGRTLLHAADTRMYEDKFERRQTVEAARPAAALEART